VFSQAHKDLFNGFWNNNNDREAPIDTKRPRWLVPRRKGLSGNLPNSLSPADAAPSLFGSHIEKEYSYFREFQDDIFWIANPINPPYMELMWGAPLLYRENGFWPGKPLLKPIPAIIEEAEKSGAVRAKDQWAELYIDYCGYAKFFDYGMFHLHSAYTGLLDDILTIEELSAVQVTIDFMGPEITSLTEELQKIQYAGKKMILRGNFSKEDLSFLSSLLNPAGAIITTIIEPKEGKKNEDQKKAV
jgi:hypothetical protein